MLVDGALICSSVKKLLALLMQVNSEVLIAQSVRCDPGLRRLTVIVPDWRSQKTRVWFIWDYGKSL
jgi:hypothetical protein